MKTALLVIDAQKAYTTPGSDLFCSDNTATIRRVNRIIDKFEKHGEPIILVRHRHRADGSDLGRMYDYLGDQVEGFEFCEGTEEVDFDDRLLRPEGAVEIKKNRYSAFAGTNLHEHLQNLGVERVVVVGFMTNFCCESTAREAHDADYYVDFVLDATGSPGTETLSEEDVRKIVGEFMLEGFSQVWSTEDFLREYES